MSILSKFRRAIDQPERYDYFVRSRLNKAILLANRGRYGALVSLIVAGIIGRDFYGIYLSALRRVVPNGLVIINLDDDDLILDLSDPGISRDLLLYGTREEKPANIFENELRQIVATESEVICFDVGANIGYYTIIQARSIDNGGVHAIEPVDRNVELLTKNIQLNGYSDEVVIEKCGIGAETDVKRLHLSDHSNLHHVGNESNRADLQSHDAIDVTIRSLDDYVERHGIDFESVNAVRMDLEGYETEVIRGMSSILKAPGPTLLYLEVHNHLLEHEKLTSMLNKLKTAGFEIIAVEYDIITAEPLHLTHDIDSWDELEEIDDAYSLIVKKQ